MNYAGAVKLFFVSGWSRHGATRLCLLAAVRPHGLTRLAKSPIATSLGVVQENNPKAQPKARGMLECEVKFFIANPERVRDRLQRAGALPTGSAFETNYRYDRTDNALLARQCLLRLRRDRRNLLTYKTPDSSGGRQIKTHQELEIEVSDFDTTHQILEALGFHRAQMYEKRRETYEMGSVEICLDHLPYGHFIEIEGAADMLSSAAAGLDLAWRRRILANYLQIFEAIRSALRLPFNDVSFAHFQTVQADLTALIRRFEADPPP
jgi:adenylate cyclase, class 2